LAPPIAGFGQVEGIRGQLAHLVKPCLYIGIVRNEAMPSKRGIARSQNSPTKRSPEHLNQSLEGRKGKSLIRPNAGIRRLNKTSIRANLSALILLKPLTSTSLSHCQHHLVLYKLHFSRRHLYLSCLTSASHTNSHRSEAAKLRLLQNQSSKCGITSLSHRPTWPLQVPTSNQSR
jgi:hypothetical protein